MTIDTNPNIETETGPEKRTIVLEVAEMEAIEKRLSELYEVIDAKNEKINKFDVQTSKAKDLARRISEASHPELIEVIRLISEQGSHAWRNERTLTAVFKLTELLNSLTYLTGKIRAVDIEDEFGF